MRYLTGWTFAIDKLPAYDEFKKPLNEMIDTDLLDAIIENKETDYDFVNANGEITNCTWAILRDKRKEIKNNNNVLKCNQSCGLGRFQSNSFITLPRKIKHTMFSYAGMVDIDQVKGHPRIAYGLGLKNGKSYPAFKKYIENTDSIFAEMGDYYGVDVSNSNTKDRLKWFFNLAIYGGGFNTWLEGIINPSKKDQSLGYRPLTLKNHDIMPFMQQYMNECHDLTDKLWANNDGLRSHLETYHPEYNTKKEHEKKRCVVSYCLQIVENDALHKAFIYLKKNKYINPTHVSLEYDGLCFVPKSTINDDVIHELNTYVAKQTGFDIKYAVKPYRPENIYDDMIDIVKQMKLDRQAEKASQSYESIKERFEKTYAKLGDKHTFVKKTDTECLFYNRANFRVNHEDIIYIEDVVDKDGNVIGTKKKQFIDEWFKDPEKKTYIDVGVYPDASKCPDNVLNLWMPFAMDLVKEYTPTLDDREFFLNHILQLCDYDKAVYDYLIKWVAQMIQYPEVKTTCPIMISEEGAGKGTFMELIKLMIGKGKYLSTSTPNESVWGSKNGLMKDAFFVNLDELSGKEAVGADGRIKTLISEPTIEIRQMYLERIVIPSFHRFFATTNNDECIGKKKGDRRKFIIYSSTDKCRERFRNDPEKYQELCKYHEKTHTLLKDVNFVKTMFDYFKYEVEDQQQFLSLEMPETEFDKQAQEIQKPVITSWVEYLALENNTSWDNQEPEKWSAAVLFDEFNRWIQENKIAYECNSVKFGVRLSRLKIKGISEPLHSKKGNYRMINWREIVKHLGIDGFTDDEEEDF